MLINNGKAVIKKRLEQDASALHPVKDKRVDNGKGDNSRPANLNAGNK